MSRPANWRPIITAPRAYSPPLSTVNHHAPDIVLWRPALGCVVASWSKARRAWVGGDDQPIIGEPVYWTDTPYDPNEIDFELVTGEARLTAHLPPAARKETQP